MHVGPSARHMADLSKWALQVRQQSDGLLAAGTASLGELLHGLRDEEFARLHGRCKGVIGRRLTSLVNTVRGSVVRDAEREEVRAALATLADRIDVALDEHHAHRLKAQNATAVSSVSPATAAKAYEPSAVVEATPAPKRPQDAFYPPVDNSNVPFQPDFSAVAAVMDSDDSSATSSPGRGKIARHALQLNQAARGAKACARYRHPFAQTLATLPAAYRDAGRTRCVPLPPLPLDSTPCHFVDEPSALDDMVAHLRGCHEVAIDLEHSDRSFQGFTCLMQVSSRSRDFVVDALALRAHLGPALAAVFADKGVQKVLHGADYDVMWLQKDFGLFLVNMFDTGQAARVLNLPCGLASLLSDVCGVKTDKKFQRADWRVRPLTSAMMHYARLDTHYLLYIADVLKGQLFDAGDAVPAALQVPLPADGPQGAFGTALERSRALCLELYEKPLFHETDYLAAYRRLGVALGRDQLAVFAGLFAWRDRTARVEDDAPARVLSKANLISLSQRMPGTAAKVLAAVRRPSHALSKRLEEVAETIQASRAQAAEYEAYVEVGTQLASEPSPSAEAVPGLAPGPALDCSSASDASIEAPAAPAPGAGARRCGDGGSSALVADAGLERAPSEGAGPAHALPGDEARGFEQVQLTGLRVRNVTAGPAASRGRHASMAGRGGVASDASAATVASARPAPRAGRLFRSGLNDGPARHASTGVARQSGTGVACAGQEGASTAPVHAESPCALPTGGARTGRGGRCDTFCVPHVAASLLPEESKAGECDQAGTTRARDEPGPGVGRHERDRAAEVRAAVDEIRKDAVPAKGSSEAPGALREEGGDAQSVQPLSLRERHGRKRRRSGGASDDGDGLLEDVTIVKFGARNAKCSMPRNRPMEESVDAFDFESALAKAGAAAEARRRRDQDVRARSGFTGRRRGRDVDDRDSQGKRVGRFEGRRSGAYNPYALDSRMAPRGARRGSGGRSGFKSATFLNR